ncbi:MAG: hypothetical protein K2X66_13085, partial [Cyanobacteria bacterium]|nr:hypothetical protein [Cyanobacteriota bacterium]
LKAFEGLNQSEMGHIKNAVSKVFGESSQGIVARSLYGHANLAHLTQELFSTHLLEKQPVRELFESFAVKLNRSGSLSIISGIAAGALFGGFVVQTVNDRFIGPVVEPFLARVFGLDNPQNGSDTTIASKNGKFLRKEAPLTQAQRSFRC